MAKKISELPVLTTLDDLDSIPVVDTSEAVTKQTTIRNLADSIHSPIGFNRTNFIEKLADFPPFNPHPMNDEFNGATLDPKWSWLNKGESTIDFKNSRLYIQGSLSSSDSLRILEQPIPLDSSWSATVKLRPTFAKVNYRQLGIVVRNSTTNRLVSYHVGWDSTRPNHFGRIRWNSPTNYNSWSTNINTGSNGDWPNWAPYIRIRVTSTHVYGDYSFDGEYWASLSTGEELSQFLGTITHVGLFCSGTNNQPTGGWFDFFRVNWEFGD